MPTATSTVTKTAYSNQFPLKASIPLSPVSAPPPAATTNATLRTLYNRAARAFLLRDISLTHSLIESAFALIKPPTTSPDALADNRRKWDILRITLETTVYGSPPQSSDALPQSLRDNLTESPHALITAMYTRSLALFTPISSVQKVNVAYLPSSVLITLVYSTLKIDCPDVGRIVIEEWLARRDPSSSYSSPRKSDEDSYEKILELYCTQVLPKLELWDYAEEFLQYEGELSVHSREHIKSSLKSLYEQAISLRQSHVSIPEPELISPRSYSPAPSSSSSLSTTSTHTIVPSTLRASRPGGSMASSTSITPNGRPSSPTSSDSDSTATPRQRTRKHSRPRPRSRPTHSSSIPRNRSHSSTSPLLLPRSPPQSTALRPGSLSVYSLIKSSLAPYVTSSKLTTFFVLFVLFPLISYILRIRHRRRRALIEGSGGGSSAAITNVDLVRRRLQNGVGGSDSGLLGRFWGELRKAVGDTVRMGGSGLV